LGGSIVNEYSLLPEAESDLEEIVDHIGRESGRERAAQVYAELLRGVRNLAAYRRIGHARPDLTAKAVRVWPVYSYLIVFHPGRWHPLVS